jgi:hypothetical protein
MSFDQEWTNVADTISFEKAGARAFISPIHLTFLIC